MSINRREFLKAVSGAIILHRLSSESAEASQTFGYLSSNMSAAELEKHKLLAIRSLAESIPKTREFDYLRAYIPYLPNESQMYIPGNKELEDVVAKSIDPLNSWGASIPTGKHGLFIFADAHNGKRVQRIYVLKRVSDTQLQFIKGYKVSLSRDGFGNEKDSGKTPIGIHTIQSKTIGKFGELVSKKKVYKDEKRLFRHARIDGKDHWFVNSFGYETDNEIAEVVTDEYLLVSPTTSAERGVRIHGTNRSGGLNDNNEWVSYLDGKSLTTACIRMANGDVRDLNINKYIDTGGSVLIYATPAAMSALPETSKDLDPAGRWDPDKY